jgi:hypothetical protein
MAYCRKCGAQIKEDDVFCFLCGQPIDRQVNKEAFAVAETGNETVVSEQARTQMSKEESIALAEKLRDEYSAIERLQREINDNQTALKKPVVLFGRRYSMFRFFWPFFIFAYLALNVIYIVGIIISAGNDNEDGFLASFFIAMAAAVGILLAVFVPAAKETGLTNSLQKRNT